MTGTNELELVTQLAELLSSKGVTSLAYYTAEFQPFSNAQRPDLVFQPTEGSWAGQTAVVELKIEAAPRKTGRSFQNLIEHREFCEQALERPVFRYIFVTNQPIPEFSLAKLAEAGIVVVFFNDDLAALAKAIGFEFGVSLGG